MILAPLHTKSESFGTDVDERLGVAYEFKIHVDPGKEDCFFQQVHAHSSLYVAFQVSHILTIRASHPAVLETNLKTCHR